MTEGYSIRIFSQEDLIKAGCLNIKEAIDVTEDAFIRYSQNDIIFPSKVSVVFDQATQNRINCLPAGIIDDNVYGMKWISVFPQNPHRYGKANVSALILLSELTTGYPVALLDGCMVTDLRTAAVGALAARFLARDNSESIGIIGAGEIGKAHLLAMKCVLQSLKVCRVASRSDAGIEKFIKQMKRFCPDVLFINCHSNYQMTSENSDVIVTAISGQEKLLQADWIKDGTFYCHAAGLEDDFEVPLKASKIVCDEWEIVKHRTQTISQMYKQGLITDKNIYADLVELITHKKPGRENESEFIYFNSVGLSFIDVMVANWMYKKALGKGFGQLISMKERSMFDSEI